MPKFMVRIEREQAQWVEIVCSTKERAFRKAQEMAGEHDEDKWETYREDIVMILKQLETGGHCE